jgi:hypothetical protein
LGTASARRTSRPELHCLVIHPDPSWGRGGHAKVKAQVGATRKATTTHFISEGVAPSKGLAINLSGGAGFDNKLPGGGASERHVPPVVQTPVDDIKDDGRGNDGEDINLASLSLGSDTEKLVSLSFGSNTEYLAKTYVIVDPKVEQNGSLAMESLLEPEITKPVTSVLSNSLWNKGCSFQRLLGTSWPGKDHSR